VEDRNAATICAAERLVPIDLLLVNDMAGVCPARRRNVPAQPHWNHFRVSSSHPPAGCPLLGMSAISITFVRFWPGPWVPPPAPKRTSRASHRPHSRVKSCPSASVTRERILDGPQLDL